MMRDPDWLYYLKCTVKDEVPKTKRLTALTSFRSNEIPDCTQDKMLQILWYIEFGFQQIVPINMPPEENEIRKIRAIQSIAREIYKEPLDELYRIRHGMYKRGIDPDAVEEITQLIGKLRGMM